MRLGNAPRGLVAGLMVAGLGVAATTVTTSAQDDSADNELSVGLYLGDCENLVEGAALYDLGDAEFETENFDDADENTEEGEGTAEADLEDQIDEESSGDETDVQGDDSDNSDEEVVAQDGPAVWVAQDAGFEADLVDVVDAPFAIAIRTDADDSANADDTEGAEGDDFVACGEFNGAVAGDEIVIPLIEQNNSGYFGIAILSDGDDEGTASSSAYLFNRDQETGSEGADATPTS